MPSRMTMSTKNFEAVKSNLRQYGARSQARAREVVAASMERTLTIAQGLCPYDREERDDFHMIEVLKGRVTEGGLAYEVGFEAEDFTNAGQPFYPIYTEFGTSKMAAQPCVFPARDQERPRFRRELAEALSPSRSYIGTGKNK